MKICHAAAILLVSVQSIFAQLVPYQTNSVWLSDSAQQYDTIVGVQACNELWFYAYSIDTNSFSLANYTVKYYWNDETYADDSTSMTNISGTVSGNKVTFAPTTNTWTSLIDSGYSEIIVTDTNGANYVLARGATTPFRRQASQ